MHSVNPLYLEAEFQAALRKQFQRGKSLPHVALEDFLTMEELERTVRSCARGWKTKIIPDRYIREVKEPILLNEFLAVFAKRVVGGPVLRDTNRRFGHRDYERLYGKKKQEAGIVAYFFTDDWNQDWGGNIVFVKAGAALGRFTPRKNTLLIVERKHGVRSFVKYVNHRAKKRKLTILS